MGAIADSIAAYARPLIDATDGSLPQLQRALSIGQACWNLALLPEERRPAALEGVRDALQMSPADFDRFRENILAPMMLRHEEMFPKMHQRSNLESPHWEPARAQRRPRVLPMDIPPQQPLDEPLDLDESLRELDEAMYHFPEAALRACQAERELAIPKLIDFLDRAVRYGGDGAVPVGNATIFALYLLTEFKATDAIPAIWRLLKLPTDVLDHLLGDSLTEDLPRILAVFSGPRLEMLAELIADRSLDKWVRTAASHASRYLVRDGLLPRQTAIAWLQTHLAEAIRVRDEVIPYALIHDLIALNANDARPEIERAFQEGLVDEEMLNLREVNDTLRPAAPNECNAPPYRAQTEITDTVEEMRHWHWKDNDDDESDDFVEDISSFDRDTRPQPWPIQVEREEPWEPATIRHEAPRVGRNDPCPCGSGKKYKKCCLRSAID